MKNRDQRLLLAAAATLPGAQARQSRQLGAAGWATLERYAAELEQAQRDAASALAEDLAERHVDVLLVGDNH